MDEVSHMEWHGGAFERCNPAPPPQLKVEIQVLDACHEKFGRRRPRSCHAERVLQPVPVTAIVDSGAQTCTSGLELLRTLNIRQDTYSKLHTEAWELITNTSAVHSYR